jgi:hypothetical protein
VAERTIEIRPDLFVITGGSNRRCTIALCALLVSLFADSSFSRNTIASEDSFTTGPIVYATESRTAPRPLVIHRLVVDLQAPEFRGPTPHFELAVAVGEDTDGDGPIEAALTAPVELAERENLIAAINTNPWAMLPKPPAGTGSGYVAGATTNISGWVRANGINRSPQEPGHWSVWIDDSSLAHIGETSATENVQCAVAGFRGLLKDRMILPEPSDVRHPRTAAGVHGNGRHLTLLVVDGRQPGYSEGVSELELAELMLEFGCSDAVNLDGGGSTVMLLGEQPDSLAVKNRPCDPKGPRPVPVMLGIRQAAQSSTAAP